MKKLKNILQKIKNKKSVMIIDQLLWRFTNTNIQAYSAQIAYFTLLSIFPFLVVLLNIISRFSIVNPEAVNQVISILPPEAQSITQAVLSDLTIGFGSDLQLIISILGGLYSASLGVKPIITTCAQSFGIKEGKKGIKLIITGFVFTLGFIAMLNLLFITKLLGDKIFELISDFLHLPDFISTIWYYIGHLLTPIYMVLTLYLINRYSLPREERRKIAKRHMIPGAILSTALMVLLSSVFSLVNSYSNKYALTYGSISGVIILIVWLFLMGNCLILGFELNGSIYEIYTKSKDELKEKSVIESVLSKIAKGKEERTKSQRALDNTDEIM